MWKIILKNLGIKSAKLAKEISTDTSLSFYADANKAIMSFSNEKLDFLFNLESNDKVFFNSNGKKDYWDRIY